MRDNQVAITRETILEYLPLIKKVVSRIFPKVPPQVCDFEDLVGYGVMGLIEASSTFDAHKGVKFSTYAFYRIRGAILDALRSLDWMPRTLREKIHMVEKVSEELISTLGREPTEEEIASELNMDTEEVSYILMNSSQSAVVSLEDNLHNYLVSKTDNFMNMDDVAVGDLKNVISSAIEELPERERMVLILYYYEELNLKEIGKVLDLTESRVSQILKKAVEHLKGKLDFLEKEI